MHLSRLFIRNYRSIEELDLRFTAGKNVIVGRNNSGKSNILSAADLLLGETSPDYKKSDNIVESDFYSRRIRKGRGYATAVANDIFIWCELTRSGHEALDFEELYKCYGFYACSDFNRSVNRRRFTLEPLESHYVDVFELSEEDAAKTYINPKLKNQATLESEFDDKFHFAFAFRAIRSECGIEKQMRLLYRENESIGWVLAFRASVRNALLQSAIIPSFRDPQHQLRISSWSWYGKLLRYLTEAGSNLPRLTTALQKLQDVANEVFAAAQEKISQSALSVAFPGTELSFQFATDKHDDLYKGCVIYIDDGFKSLLTEKGSGIQSATIIGLFNFYTREVNTTGSALLGIEEPELYLHPHARRVVSDRLDEFLDNNRNQVIITTHSIEFLRSIYTDVNIILVKKSSRGPTTAQAVSLRAFQALLRDNNQNELFFADKVIVCEGYDEYVIKAASKELFKGRLDAENVSVIGVSGKDNVAALVRLILRLGIDCFVIADFDYLLRDKSDRRKLYDAKAHDSVANLPTSFFTQPCILARGGAKGLKAVQLVRTYIKSNLEKQFYQAKNVKELGSHGLTDFLCLLRRSGICILEGEIEELSTEPAFLSPTNKLTLEKIYAIRRRLISGEKLSSFMRLAELKDFLASVFDTPNGAKPTGEAVLQAARAIR